MESFLLLGIIPGTNIQITFSDWLRVVSSLALFIIALALVRRRDQLAHLLTAIRHRTTQVARLA